MDVQELRNLLERQKGQKLQIEDHLKFTQLELKEKIKSLSRHEKAKEIIREVGMKTQQQLQINISDITSLALEAVFPDPYELKVEFIQRRNKTECDLYFVRRGNRLDPLESSGLGTVDIASFALRIASWSMARPKTMNTIILDEPFKFLSEDRQEQASLMLKEISKKLGIQFIIVTHKQILASAADRVFKTKLRKGITTITTYDNESGDDNKQSSPGS